MKERAWVLAVIVVAALAYWLGYDHGRFVAHTAPTSIVEKHDARKSAVASAAPSGVSGIRAVAPRDSFPTLNAAPAAPEALIDPNTATAEQLDRLPGVGPAIAARILADRAANGPYRAPEDLLRVKGVGPALLARLAPYLSFGRVSSR